MISLISSGSFKTPWLMAIRVYTGRVPAVRSRDPLSGRVCCRACVVTDACGAASAPRQGRGEIGRIVTINVLCGMELVG